MNFLCISDIFLIPKAKFSMSTWNGFFCPFFPGSPETDLFGTQHSSIKHKRKYNKSLTLVLLFILIISWNWTVVFARTVQGNSSAYEFSSWLSKFENILPTLKFWELKIFVIIRSFFINFSSHKKEVHGLCFKDKISVKLYQQYSFICLWQRV